MDMDDAELQMALALSMMDSEQVRCACALCFARAMGDTTLEAAAPRARARCRLDGGAIESYPLPSLGLARAADDSAAAALFLEAVRESGLRGAWRACSLSLCERAFCAACLAAAI